MVHLGLCLAKVVIWVRLASVTKKRSSPALACAKRQLARLDPHVFGQFQRATVQATV